MALPAEEHAQVFEELWPRARVGDADALARVDSLSWLAKVNIWRPKGTGWGERVASDLHRDAPEVLRNAAVRIAASRTLDDASVVSGKLVDLLAGDAAKLKDVLDLEALLRALTRHPTAPALAPVLRVLEASSLSGYFKSAEALVMAILCIDPSVAPALTEWRAQPDRPSLKRLARLEAQTARAAAADLGFQDLETFVEAEFVIGVERALRAGIDPTGAVDGWGTLLHLLVGNWTDMGTHANTVAIARALTAAGADANAMVDHDIGDEDLSSWKAGATPVKMTQKVLRQLAKTGGTTIGDEYRDEADAEELLAALGVQKKAKTAKK